MKAVETEGLTTEAGGGFAPFKVFVSCCAALPPAAGVEGVTGLEIVLVVLAELVPALTFAACATTVTSVEPVLPAEEFCVPLVVGAVPKSTGLLVAVTGCKVCAANPVAGVSEAPDLVAEPVVKFWSVVVAAAASFCDTSEWLATW